MHIVQYKALDMRREFATKLHNKLVKKATNEQQVNNIMVIIMDIAQVLKIKINIKQYNNS